MLALRGLRPEQHALASAACASALLRKLARGGDHSCVGVGWAAAREHRADMVVVLGQPPDLAKERCARGPRQADTT